MSHKNADNNDANIQDLEKTAQAGPTDAVELRPGAVLHDRYKVIGLLGRGGMGSVYRVEHLLLQRTYALKVLNKQQTNEAAWRRFELEARAANKLDHPNLVKVHDSDLLPDGQPYFIMDLIEGESLADILKERGRLPLDRALKIFIQVGFALSYAHSNGVIHRDIKPSNIMVSSVDCEDGHGVLVKVVDFGIAKLTGIDEFNQQTLTKTGEIFGSPLYMSPEQCLGTAIDRRCDLYSMGCVIYEALTGAPPLVGENALATMMKHQSEMPLSLKEASMGVEFPEKMEEIVARLLEKDPKQRYQSAQHLTAELVGLDSGQLSMFEATPLPPPIATTQQEKRYRNIVLAFCAVSIFIAGVCAGQSIPRRDINMPSAPMIAHTFDEPGQSLLHVDKKLKEEKKTHKKLEEENFAELEKMPGFFSKNGSVPGERLFYFPSFPIGDLIYNTNHLTPAQGTRQFKNFKGLSFGPAEQFQKRPKLFQKFRPDDIGWLDLSSRAHFMNLNEKDLKSAQTALFGISHLTGIRSIDLGDTILSPESLLQIDKLPKLSKLLLTRINLSGQEISKLKCLEQLTLLKLVGMENVKPLIKRIKRSKKLEALVLAGCSIDNDDLKDIAEIKQLAILELADNPNVNDDSIRLLSPALQNLDLRRCPVTQKSANALLRLQRLKELRLSATGWSEDEIAKLQKQIPGAFFSEGEEK